MHGVQRPPVLDGPRRWRRHVSRDFTSAEWMETLLRHPRQQLAELERTIRYIREQAFREGATAHLRGSYQECPFCKEGAADLPRHLILCEEVPEHLREDPLPS